MPGKPSILALSPLLWMVVPPAIYFLRLGLRRSGRAAKVVPGWVDAAWLVFGFGGFVVFGPIGQTLSINAKAGWSIGAISLAGALLSTAWIARGRRRLVVYNVDPAVLEEALREAIAESPRKIVKSVRGYEDPVNRLALIVEIAGGSRTAELSVEGPGGDGWAASLNPCLSKALARRPLTKPTRAWNDFVLANLILATPLIVVLMTQPQAQKDLGRWISGMLRTVVKSPAEERPGRRSSPSR